jgi:hypothetical protein
MELNDTKFDGEYCTERAEWRVVRECSGPIKDTICVAQLNNRQILKACYMFLDKFQAKLSCELTTIKVTCRRSRGIARMPLGWDR